jgi:hypothetical protein
MARPEGGYFTPDHVRIVSVTEALSTTRVRRWQGNPAAWERRATIGSAVHRAAAILDVNKLAWDTAPYDWLEQYDAVSPEVKPMVKAWEHFKREQAFKVRLVEHTFCPVQTGITSFATTIDREGILLGEPAIVEIKTPKVREPYWGVQLAGQELAVVKSQGPPRERPWKYKRVVVQLFATEQYRVLYYDDPADLDVFLWSLGIAVWNNEHYK